MNFIAATVEYKSAITDPITIYGLEYCGADVSVPGTGSNAEVRFRALCYNREGAKLSAFKEWKQGNRALITGTIMFLLSDKSNYINGQNIIIDGGYTA